MQGGGLSWPAPSPLVRRADTTPERTALVDAGTGEEWGFRDLASRANRLGRFLRAQGLPKDGETRPRVGYLLDPGSAFVTTLYSLWDLGWVPVGLHTDLTPGGLGTQGQTAELDGVIYQHAYDSLVRELDCPTVPIESALDAEGPDVAAEDAEGPDIATEDRETREVATWERDETALVLFTSGTTGEPKGVRLTLGNLVASATVSAFRLGVDPADRWLCCLPVSHMGGLAPAVRTVLYGTTLVVQRHFDAEETGRVLDEYGVTEVSLVPTQLTRLLDAGWRPSDSLDTVLLGGAPASESLLERCERADIPVYTTYGMTETASQIATARPSQRRAYPGTVGNPLVGTEVTILADDTPVPPGEHGEIVVDGATLTPGYLDRDRTDDAFSEYGFHTGDVGYRDAGGRLWVTGRTDDMILTGGELVSPVEVADTLLTHEGVEDAAVVGLADDEWGEQVAALVVPAGDISPETVSEHCRDRLAAFKVPKTLLFAADLPRTGSGTVDRQAVRELLSDERT